MLTRIELDPRFKLSLSASSVRHYSNMPRKKLLDTAITNTSISQNINTRLIALFRLHERLSKTREEIEKNQRGKDPKSLLDDAEIRKLYNLVRDEYDFPIIVDREERLDIQEVAQYNGQPLDINREGSIQYNGRTYSTDDKRLERHLVQDIEENDAVLRGVAAFLIVDFGSHTPTFQKIKYGLIKALTGILNNMIEEEGHIFIKDRSISKDRKGFALSSYFINFIEALYFIDKQAAKPFMESYNISENNFDVNRREREKQEIARKAC